MKRKEEKEWGKNMKRKKVKKKRNDKEKIEN